jgi:hypothetical protein
MPRIRNEEPIPAEYVENLLRGSAPERVEDIKALWKKYEPQFFVADDGPGVLLSANKKRIVFDRKTMAVYWLLSFAGWKVLECYSPAVYGSLPAGNLSGILGLPPDLVRKSFPPNTTIAQVLDADDGLVEAESRFSGTIYIAQSILDADRMDETDWPRDIPPPEADREQLANKQDKATYDLAVISTAYAFCHELRHLMFAKDGDTPSSRPAEELACDAWAREFLTQNVAAYAKAQSVDAEAVLAKRSIAGTIGIFVLYETSERHGDAGSAEYPPIADRMNVTLADTPLDRNHKFWTTYACVLVAILRRRNARIDVTAQDAKQLCELLVEKIRATS